MAITIGDISLQMGFNGNPNDLSMYNNQVAPQSGVITYNANNKVEGTASAVFTEDDAHLAMPSNDIFDFGTGPFTVEFSIYPQSTSLRFQSILSNNGTSYINGSIFFQLRADARITVGGRDFTPRPDSPALTNQQWHDVCITRTTSGTLYFLVTNKVTNVTQLTTEPEFLETLNLNGPNGVSVGRTVWDNDDGRLFADLDALRVLKGVSVFENLSNSEIMDYQNFYLGDDRISEVSGNVTLDGNPTSSIVVATQYDPSITNPVKTVVFGQSNTDAITGDYTIRGFGNVNLPVLVNTVQEYGVNWSAGVTLSIGDTVHPTTANGYFYRVLEAGTTGGAEPTWVTDVGQTVNDNGVIYQAEILLKPEIEGYLTPTPI